MAGLPKFLYSESSQTDLPLITPAARDGEGARWKLEGTSTPMTSEFGDVGTGTARTLLGQTSRSTLNRYSANSVPGDYVFYKGNNKRTKWEEAALYVHEGEDNDKFINHPMGKWSKLAYTVLHNPIFYVSDLIVSILLMLLALMEKPTFFERNEKESTHILNIHAVLELLFLFLLTIDIVLRLIWLRPNNFFRHKRTVLVTVVLIVMLIEAFVVVSRQKSHIRITRALRPLFFIDTYLMFGVRRVLRQIFQSLKPVVDVLLLILFVIVFFALIGYFLFAEINPDYFQSFSRSYVSLFIALTTANHPDVMMEAYNRKATSAIFFVIYIIITVYFISNVLLAVVYSTFSDEEKKKFKKLFLHKREALHHAYNVLAKSNGIEFHDFLLFMQKYKPRMPEWQVMCVFKVLHGNPNEPFSDLTIEEFYSFYEVRNFKWRQVTAEGEDPLWFANFHPRIKLFFGGVHKIVLSRFFNPIVYVITLVNTVFLVIYTWTIPSNDPDDRFEKMRTVLPVSFVFAGIYSVEVGMRIIALGPIGFFRKFYNSADFVVVTVSFLCLGLEIDPAYQIVVIVRPLKLVRLLRLKRRYRDIMNTLVILSPRLLSIAFLLIVIYYFFAIIGMEFLQGQVYEGCCENAWYDVGQFYNGSPEDFTVNVYYRNNFDSILESYVTLFILMVVNNWFIIMEGFTSAVKHGWLARAYFMVFYIITLVVLQVVISFIVEAFVLNIQTTERRRVCAKTGRLLPRDCDTIDDTRKKEVEVLLVDDDISKLQYEMTYHDEAKRDWTLNLNTRIRQFRRVDRHKFKAPLKYSGHRLRTKDDIHLLMYKEELPHWVEEQERILANEDQDVSPHKRLREKLGTITLKILEYLLE